MTFQCERCGHTGRYSTWVTARWRNENVIHRCERCGTAYSARYGREAEVITPPFVDHGRVAPWCDGRYKPYRIGAYDCAFRDGLEIRLWWNGASWTWTGLVVDVTNLNKWRGRWPYDDE